jgi:hypothetical protein
VRLVEMACEWYKFGLLVKLFASSCSRAGRELPL